MTMIVAIEIGKLNFQFYFLFRVPYCLGFLLKALSPSTGWE